MDKIFDIILLPADKANHSFWLTFAFSVMVVSGIVVPLIALGIVAVAAAAKEVYDYLHQDTHTADVWDFVAGVLPSIIITICHISSKG